MNTEDIKAGVASSLCPTYARYPLAIERGAGTKLFTPEGREYTDLLAGIAVCGLGHSHPELAETIAARVQEERRLMYVGITRAHGDLGAVAAVLDIVPAGIELLLGVGFEHVGAGVAVDNHALIFDEHSADAVAGNGVAALSQMHTAGFVAVDFDRAQFDGIAEMLAGQVGNVHGNRNGQGVTHADIVEHVFECGLLVVEIGEVFFFEAV